MHEAYYDRETMAMRDLGTTQISPWHARTLVSMFLLSIVLTPAIELVGLIRSRGTLSETLMVWIGNVQAEDRLSRPEDSERLGAELNEWQRILRANADMSSRLASLEQMMSRQSWPVSFFQPVQPALVRLLGLNTQSVSPGRDQWLFYVPDLEHLIGPGFLKDSRSGQPWSNPGQSDLPIRIILDFHHQLSERGIRLVVMPVPAKPAIHPEALSQRYSTGLEEPLENRSFAAFRSALQEAGVAVVDLSPQLFRTAGSGSNGAYLKTDTHWSPESVVKSADILADWIEDNVEELTVRRSYASEQLLHTGTGDLALMLSGGKGSRWYPAEEVELRRITSADSDKVYSERCEILLMGDSFANIYSLPEMNWGESAGLVEQLSYALGRPVDRIAQNHDGAIATRRGLARELAREPERFEKIKLVIWQFAARELSIGNWQPVQLPPVQLQPLSPLESSGVGLPPELLASAEDGTRLVTVQIISKANLPQPGQVPYRDALLALEAMVLDDSSSEATRGVIYVWGMRDNHWLPAASLRAGQRLSLRLTDWSVVEDRLGRFARAELDDPEFELLDVPTYYGEPVE